MIRLSLISMAGAAPAFAQDHPVDRAAVLACFEATAGNANPSGCIGAVAEICVEQSDVGHMKAGMVSYLCDADCACNGAIFQNGTMRSLVLAGSMPDMPANRVRGLHSHLEAPF